jgi:predicted dehydrogenase
MHTLTKLNKTEQRALEACRDIRANARAGSPSTVALKWTKRGLAARVASVRYAGERIASAGGGNYDKRSHALAAALQWLGETPEQRRAVAMTGGAGVSCLASALAALGWHLEQVSDVRNVETYTLTLRPA